MPRTAPISRILVPVDFSACSRAALDYAAELASRNDAVVEVLHVQEPTPFLAVTGALSVVTSGTIPRRSDESRGEVVRELEGFVGRERADVSVRVETGLPGDVIPAVAKQGAFDLIVMGTHGRSGLARAVLGSVAETVMRRAPVPVLTLRMPRHEPRESIPL